MCTLRGGSVKFMKPWSCGIGHGSTKKSKKEYVLRCDRYSANMSTRPSHLCIRRSSWCS